MNALGDFIPSVKMNPQAKRLWVDALRSGKYFQTRGYLRVDSDDVSRNGVALPKGFCCLGVLCDLSGCTWEFNVEGAMTATSSAGVGDSSAVLLPYTVEDACKLPRSVQRVLAYANDGGFSFAELADWIESNL